MFRERVSHALSKVLRHTANAEGIGIRADGFCSVRELLKLQVFKARRDSSCLGKLAS